ncbi:hypothetical protein LWI28_023107 [Acer negundo]|uniref:Myb/SANT-like domain-containing protein n=1 Tax=Acer negundo TaxID=4023 RepID=A0AAD5NRA4_ACENE|nr:hypothetical protein LWI28_023107 [Acer negundo]
MVFVLGELAGDIICFGTKKTTTNIVTVESVIDNRVGRRFVGKLTFGEEVENWIISSGFGWDAIRKKFIAPEEVWEDYFKSHPTYRGLHNKNCDDYEDLQILIGNATATGKNSLGLGDETDARTFDVEDKQTALDDFVYDETNEAFVTNQNEPSHQPPPLGQSFSHLPFPTTSSEVHPVSTNQKKRTRTINEGNSSPAETNHKAVIMEKISLSIDFIAADFRGVPSLLEKREKDREKGKR